MNKTFLGLPMVLIIFILAILVPVVIGDAILYQNAKKPVLCGYKVNTVYVQVTPTPSVATSSPLLKKVVTPTKKPLTVTPSKTK